jgi:predicted RNA-binding protein YlxR (DUF448 family)
VGAAPVERVEPTRTCALTRTAHPRDALIRLAASPEGHVVVDLKARLPGRGVWISPTTEALALLPRLAPKLAHQLGVPVDAEAVARELRAALLASALDGLGIAAGAGALATGRDAVLAAIEGRRAVMLVTSQDASPRLRADLEAARGTLPLVVLDATTDALGTVVGRALAAAIAVGPGHATQHLRRQLRRLSALG